MNVVFKFFDKKNTVNATMFFGLIFGCYFLLVAWDHNPQEEFHSDVSINYVDCFMVFISWYLYGFVLGMILSFLVDFFLDKCVCGKK